MGGAPGGGGQGAACVFLSRLGVLQPNLPPAWGGSGEANPARGWGCVRGEQHPWMGW